MKSFSKILMDYINPHQTFIIMILLSAVFMLLLSCSGSDSAAKTTSDPILPLDNISFFCCTDDSIGKKNRTKWGSIK